MAVKDDIFALTEPLVRDLGLELVDVEYLKEGPRWVIRVFLYQRDGVSLDDCQKVSDALGAALETEDVVKTTYHLEVSSPGAERVLKYEREFKIFQGHLVRVTTREPIRREATVAPLVVAKPSRKGAGQRGDADEGDQVMYGLLGPVTEHAIQVTDSAGCPHSLPRDNVKQVRLALHMSAPAFK